MPLQQRQLLHAAVQLLRQRAVQMPASSRLFVTAQQAAAGASVSPTVAASGGHR
jgi:hypothetical protein